jgi:ADP-L-glycero-D-manno-heptose 6-epimerase
MNRKSLIVVTGAAGFIGSCMVGYLNHLGYDNLVIVDEFSRMDKVPNLDGKKYSFKIERDILFSWLKQEDPSVTFFFHLGARTDTTEFDYSIHEKLNVKYSQSVWQYCTSKNIPLVYASSAATYGAGEYGYKDDHDLPYLLKPLNPYGISKNEFDKWAIRETKSPPHWYGLKFFNVYGPNEYHKGRMASVIFHSFNQVKKDGFVKLFRSHRPDYSDGQQLRDFIYVKDLVKVCSWFLDTRPASGLYNLGTGKARSFYDLAAATFKGLGMVPDIRFIDMPEDIRNKYQYFTEADMFKLKDAGYEDVFYSLEEGVVDYVSNYLSSNKYY